MSLKYNSKTKTLGPQAARLITTLYDENRAIFRLKDIERILGLDDVNARNFVRKLVGRGVVTRLKPGLFILVPFELGKETEYAGNPLILARELVDGNDYYLSHGTAMEIHGMVTQPQFGVRVATPKKMRTVHVMGTEFRFIPCRSEWVFWPDPPLGHQAGKGRCQRPGTDRYRRTQAAGALRRCQRSGKGHLDAP